MLNRETFFQNGQPKTEVVELPEWGGNVTIRELDATQLADLAEGVDKPGGTGGGAGQIVASVIDPETGAPLFTDADIPQLRKLGVSGLLKLNRAINRLNGFDDALKNSDASRI